MVTRCHVTEWNGVIQDLEALKFNVKIIVFFTRFQPQCHSLPVLIMSQKKLFLLFTSCYVDRRCVDTVTVKAPVYDPEGLHWSIKRGSKNKKLKYNNKKVSTATFLEDIAAAFHGLDRLSFLTKMPACKQEPKYASVVSELAEDGPTKAEREKQLSPLFSAIGNSEKRNELFQSAVEECCAIPLRVLSKMKPKLFKEFEREIQLKLWSTHAETYAAVIERAPSPPNLWGVFVLAVSSLFVPRIPFYTQYPHSFYTQNGQRTNHLLDRCLLGQ